MFLCCLFVSFVCFVFCFSFSLSSLRRFVFVLLYIHDEFARPTRFFFFFFFLFVCLFVCLFVLFLCFVSCLSFPPVIHMLGFQLRKKRRKMMLQQQQQVRLCLFSFFLLGVFLFSSHHTEASKFDSQPCVCELLSIPN